jgi:hypothetical protein
MGFKIRRKHSMRIHGVYSLLAVVSLGNLILAAQTSQCPFNSDRANSSELAVYLRQARDKTTKTCVAEALSILGRLGDRSALPLIAQYLDYEVPDEPGIPRTVLHATPTAGLYPAVDAIAAFGKDSIPTLQKVLSSNDSTVSRLALVNASRTLLFVQRDKPKAIKMILSTVMKVNQDLSVQNEIFDLLQTTVNRCPPAMYDSCVDAINGR